MPRILVPLLAVLTLAASGTPGAAGSPPTSDRDVAIFYYPWYGTPATDGAWQHWQQNGFVPPTAIASNWYPARGVYSSSDPVVVRRQMREIVSAGVTTVVVSWWGPGSVEADRFPRVARAARAAGLRVAVHVEPYPGRTPAALEADLRPLLDAGVTDYYVYDSTTSPDPEWRQLIAQVPDVRFFANTGLVGKALAGGFAGLYTYDVDTYDGSSFPRMCASARSRGLICAPSVGPGYDAVRATGDSRTRPRARGATYDRMWRAAIRAAADVVTITSYNEWHEGTQIEPARAVGAPYASYDGAYGLVGRQAEGAYLARTAVWAYRYRDSTTREP